MTESILQQVFYFFSKTLLTELYYYAIVLIV